MLTVLLGYDPLTHRPIIRSAENLTYALLNLLPDRPALTQSLRQSGALAATLDLLERQAAAHRLTVAYIWSRLAQGAHDAHDVLPWHPPTPSTSWLTRCWSWATTPWPLPRPWCRRCSNSFSPR